MAFHKFHGTREKGAGRLITALIGHSRKFLKVHIMKRFKLTLWALTAVVLLSIVVEQLCKAPDWTGGLSALVFLLVFLGWCVYAVVKNHIEQKVRRETETWFCTDCQTVSGVQDARMPGLALIYGLFLWPLWLWKKKRTCPACKKHNLIPGDSPRAMKAAAGQ